MVVQNPCNSSVYLCVLHLHECISRSHGCNSGLHQCILHLHTYISFLHSCKLFLHECISRSHGCNSGLHQCILHLHTCISFLHACKSLLHRCKGWLLCLLFCVVSIILLVCCGLLEEVRQKYFCTRTNYVSSFIALLWLLWISLPSCPYTLISV